MTQPETDRRSFTALQTDRPFGVPVIITGSSRGGTSLVAALFRAGGFDFGRNLAENQEDAEFHNAFYPAFQPERFEKVVARRKGRWGFKLPKAAMLLEEIDAVLGEHNPTYVFVYRSPMAVAFSEAKRDGSLFATLHFASLFYARMSLFSQRHAGMRNMIMCDYGMVAQDPTPLVHFICSAFEIADSGAVAARAAEVNTGEGGGYVAF